MKIRTIYFKSRDIEALCTFWSRMLGVKPHKDSDDWKEILCGHTRLGFLKLNENNVGANCVPVFEFEDDHLDEYIKRALELGATMILDGRENAKLLSAVMRDPFGNEFELSKFHHH